AARTSGPTRLRPHAKSHKCAEIARLQIEAGAIGMTTANVWEAVALVQAGIDGLLIANEVVGGEKIRRLAGGPPAPGTSGETRRGKRGGGEGRPRGTPA